MYLCSSPFSPSARTSYLLSPPRRYPPPPAPMPLAAPVPACHNSAIAPSPAVRPLARQEWPLCPPIFVIISSHPCVSCHPSAARCPPCLSSASPPTAARSCPFPPSASRSSPTPSSSSAAHRVLDFPKFLTGVGAGTTVASVRTTIALYSSSIDQHRFTPCSIPSLTLPSSITCSMPNQVELS
jgi:hypothetical protein